MRLFSAFVITVLFTTRVTHGAGPAEAIAEARSAISAKEYQRASDILHAAMPDALAIADAKKQSEALSAIHFYRALALSQIHDDATARVELREFFRLHPGKSALDPTKYPAHFMELFRVEKHPRDFDGCRRHRVRSKVSGPSPSSRRGMTRHTNDSNRKSELLKAPGSGWRAELALTV
ncbi:MAG: hypothetical protein M3P29_08445 [Acidobacteriota bacterium]|nr:hypothetical protein [Acidobacteriota bacterium]